jgi:hypothetical protein
MRAVSMVWVRIGAAYALMYRPCLSAMSRDALFAEDVTDAAPYIAGRPDTPPLLTTSMLVG